MTKLDQTHFPGKSPVRKIKRLPIGRVDRHTIHFRVVFTIELFDELVEDYRANSSRTTFSAYLRDLLRKGLTK